jgi:hypothetical protein
MGSIGGRLDKAFLIDFTVGSPVLSFNTNKDLKSLVIKWTLLLKLHVKNLMVDMLYTALDFTETVLLLICST